MVKTVQKVGGDDDDDVGEHHRNGSWWYFTSAEIRNTYRKNHLSVAVGCLLMIGARASAAGLGVEDAQCDDKTIY